MKPKNYFPANYLADRKVFRSGVVCGMTIDSLMNPSKINEYISRPDFLNTVFQLNLIDRGILKTRQRDFKYEDWLSKVISFPGYQCDQHGGIYTPDDLLNHSEHSTPLGYIYVTEPIHLSDESIREYSEFLFLEYLVSLLGESFEPAIELHKLVDTLFNDSGCQRFTKANRNLTTKISQKFPLK